VATPEGDTVTNKGGMYIKINNTLIPFPRWFYENFVAPIPQGHVVYHADGDVFNNEIDNLVCAPRQRYFNAENTEKAIRSLKARKEQLAGTINANDRKIKSTLDFKNYEKMIAENRQLYKDFRRIEKLLKKFENQINHAGYRKRT
ncbi:MAG: HNH endonuclease, partial [Prevotellaceae bacterium]|nr:HNH endonuclease [Prevotellaceae bacterium]